MPSVVPTINLFSIQEIGHPKWRVALGFRQGLFEGFFRTPCGSLRSQRQAPHPLASTNPPDLHSSNRLQRSAMRTHPPAGQLAAGVDDLWPEPFGKPRSRDLTVMGGKAEPATALKSAAERRSSPAPPRRQFGHVSPFLSEQICFQSAARTRATRSASATSWCSRTGFRSPRPTWRPLISVTWSPV